MTGPSIPGYAWVEKHSNKIPTLHAGKLTPLAIDDFEIAIGHYFDAKDTAPEKQVSTALGGFQDKHVTNWYRPPAQRARLTKLPFADFMKEFRTKFLDEDWQVDLRATILSMHQSPDQSFDDYATDVVALASLLVDEPIDDQHLRHQLEAGMSDDLRYMYMRSDKIKELNKKTPAPDVDTWVRAVNKVDEERRRNLDIHRRLLLENKENMKRNRSHTNDNDDRAPKKHHGDKSSTPKPPSGANSFSSSSKNPYPPRLSDTERDLLRNNAGCTRCRKPFAGHQGADCPAPATADNYQVVTEKLVADARRAIAKSSTAGSSKTIAAIVPPVVPDEDESDDDESDESSSDLGNRTD